MKNYHIITVLFLGLLFFTGCHEITTDNIAKVTYYVTFELTGENTLALPVGTPYVEPGAKAFENGEDVTGKMKIAGQVNSNEVGFNYITYSAVNQDGFPNSVTRTVIMYDPTVETDISGEYSIDLTYSHRLQFSNNAVIKYADMSGLYGAGDFSKYVVIIEQVVPGIFSVSDFFGGYYVEGRAYTSVYAMRGYISLNPDNSLTVLESHNDGWGDSLDNLANASYDPATGSIQWGAEYAGAYSFNVKLNKKNN